MRREQKILVTILWSLAVLGMIGVVGAGFWSKREDPPEILFDVPIFSLTDQNGRTITQADLRGNVWISMLFFTQCPGVCPMMTARMATLQRSVTAKDVKIVSFSVDPEHDTPDAMRAHAEKFGADQSRWHMLTGPKETMFEVARGLKLPAEPAKDGQPILHSQKVLLIDRQNHVRGIYDTNDDDSMKLLAEDARKLAAESGSNL